MPIGGGEELYIVGRYQLARTESKMLGVGLMCQCAACLKNAQPGEGMQTWLLSLLAPVPVLDDMGCTVLLGNLQHPGAQEGHKDDDRLLIRPALQKVGGGQDGGYVSQSLGRCLSQVQVGCDAGYVCCSATFAHAADVNIPCCSWT